MREFAEQRALAEAFVVVTPACNHSFPASLKQAIGVAYDEWQDHAGRLCLVQLPVNRRARGRPTSDGLRRAAPR
ncbi:NAD(P)H-dependent oxidoreductase [Micromonospora tulbaghiae]|uniref:NAD(P)H-dependent oxidoreductase n=1 Tax=Micromonospora tulbaghiae TaxID=479978 RepID=UPI003436CB83